VYKMEAVADQSQSQTQTQTNQTNQTKKQTNQTKKQEQTKEIEYLNNLTRRFTEFENLSKSLEEYVNNHCNSCYVCCNGFEITRRTCQEATNCHDRINILNNNLYEFVCYYFDCVRKNKSDIFDSFMRNNVWEKYKFFRNVLYYCERMFGREMNLEIVNINEITLLVKVMEKFYNENIQLSILKRNTDYKDTHFEKFKNPKKIKVINCMSDFIAKYQMKIKNLIPESHRGEIFDDLIHKTYNKDGFTRYKYDKLFGMLNTKRYQIKVMKFLAKLLYSSINVNYKKTAWSLWYLLELSSIKTPIFYFGEKPEKTRTYSISLIYRWIDTAIHLRKTEKKEYDKIFNSYCDYVNTAEIPKFYVCDIVGCDNKEEYREFVKNCNCSFNVCTDCYCKLTNPKKCPQCRRDDYSISFDRAFDSCEYKFKILYNNQSFLYSECEGNLHNGDFFFPCLKDKEIVKSRITLETDDETVKYFIDGTLSDTLEYMDREFVVNYFNDKYEDKYFYLNYDTLTSVIENGATTGSGLMNFLGLTYYEKFDNNDNMIGKYKITFEFAKKYYLEYGYQGINRENQFLSEISIKINKRNEIFSVFVGEEIMRNYFDNQYFE